MENRFTEQKNTTSDLNELKGKYIAERVCKNGQKILSTLNRVR